MNRDDLDAWKNYDNKQYALIPGVSRDKHFPVQKAPPKAGLNRSAFDLLRFEAAQNRMKQYGLTRDVREVG